MSSPQRIQSVCECQAILEADLDENRLVLQGWARRPGSEKVRAPANTVGHGDRIDAVWQCPLCGRNTLRSFHFPA